MYCEANQLEQKKKQPDVAHTTAAVKMAEHKNVNTYITASTII